MATRRETVRRLSHMLLATAAYDLVRLPKLIGATT